MLDHIRTVIFDLDGTLVDSMWMWPSIDQEFLNKRNLECPPTIGKEIEGMSFTETAIYFRQRFSLWETVEEIKEIWTEMSLEKYRTQVPLKPGAGQFLQFLKDSSISAGIATSNGRVMVDAVLETLNIRNYFQSVVTGCEVAAGKPAPDIYLKVASELNTEPDKCLVFEDVPAGILAGRRAGMKVCAIEDPFSAPMREEKRQLADYYIQDYWEILKEMERKNDT
ncbi:MAG TPA: HAD family phosphatase [Candidatus Hungatella pullicola]|nr:HAD family phosphatase [Candidatus Hungatella pullicola]